MDSFLWSIICVVLFVTGFALIFYVTDALTKSLERVAHKFQLHPVILGLLILGMDGCTTIISIVSAANGLTYVSVGNIIGNSIVSLTLCVALPLLLFREDPFLKLFAETLKKDEHRVPSFYFKLLSILALNMTLFGIIPSMADYAYNLLLIALINWTFFAVYCIKNMIKYRRSQTLEIYIESKHQMEEDRMTNKDSKAMIREEQCYDDDTDEYEVIASDKEEYEDIDAEDDMADKPVFDENMHMISDKMVELGQASTNIEMTECNKHSVKTVDHEVSLDDKSGRVQVVVSTICYVIIAVLCGELCVFAAGELMKDSVIFNERIFGYLIIPLITNIESVTYTVNMARNNQPTEYRLGVGQLVAFRFWNICMILPLCGVLLKEMEFGMVDVMNIVLFGLSVVYTSWILSYYHFKKYHAMGLLVLFAAYCFVNMVFDEMQHI